MCCPKPNPRKENLSANHKPTLAGILKRKLPETEPRKQAPSLSVGTANLSEGSEYKPRISLNPRLAGYDMNKLGICVVPYGSEVDNPQ